MFRVQVILFSAGLLVGCEGMMQDQGSMDGRTFTGRFNMILQYFADLEYEVYENPNYEIGLDEPIEDPLSNAINRFFNEEVKGTDLEPDVQKLKDLKKGIMDSYRAGTLTHESMKAGVKEMRAQIELIKENI